VDGSAVHAYKRLSNNPRHGGRALNAWAAYAPRDFLLPGAAAHPTLMQLKRGNLQLIFK